MSLQVLLPTGVIEQVECSILLSSHNLKINVEKITGIPYELQKIGYNGRLLDTNRSLADQGVPPGAVLKLEVDMWWNKLISLALQGNTTSLGRRVSMPMQQIGACNRILSTLLICATRGNPKGIDNMLVLHKDFDLALCTQVTGRTILHAAVLSGSLKCVEEIKKYAGMKFEQLLYLKDKSGLTPLDGLSANDSRMLNYVNKFLSTPLNMDQLRNNENRDNRNKENTFIVEPSIREIKERNGVKQNIDETHIEDIPRLDRDKENTNPDRVTNTVNQQAPMISVAPIIIEQSDTGRTIKIGESKPVSKDPANHLPMIPQANIQKYSPRPARKASQSSCVPTVSNKQPRPPSQDKKRPVAGKMMESNLRKFSAANRPRFVPDQHFKAPPQIKHPVLNTSPEQRLSSSGDNHLNVHLTPSSHRPMSPSPKGGEEKKIRRISLIKSPRPLSPSPYMNPVGPIAEQLEDEDKPVIIEIEEERINKPWNNWIKAVTVEAETDTESGEERPAVPSSDADEKDTTSSTLQVQQQGNVRKKSFDRWVQEKAQEEQEKELQKMREAYEKEREEEEKKTSHNGKSFDDWMREKEDRARQEKEKHEQEQKEKERKEAEEKAKLQGKSFEKWVKEKAEYDRLLKQQHEQDAKENQKQEKTLKGKTFEDWQKEMEAKRKHENEEKKMKEKEKEKQEEAKVRRRKESSAKFQQWLLDKEKLAMEKEMQELKKRKVSTAKNATRRTSTMKKPTPK